MLQQNLDGLDGSLADIKIISTDVFDTLLLRSGRSQRTRLFLGETRFARLLAQSGYDVPYNELLRARLAAQRTAYKALDIGGGIGEVRLSDLIRRQLQILSLPQRFADHRLAIELAVEKTSLFANGPLAMQLRQQRSRGVKVVAVSDTSLSADQLSELINYFHGPGLIDHVFSSADWQASKRYGSLFERLLDKEGILPSQVLHIGDDEIADVRVPRMLGLKTIHVPRSRLAKICMATNGAMLEARRSIAKRTASEFHRPPSAQATDKIAFGREVFGPIVAEFCLNIWLYADQAQVGAPASLLFCARGGIGIREAFERLSTVLRLPLSMPRSNLLVSRLVAARSAAMRRSPAVLDELGREFADRLFMDVAQALGGNTYDLSDAWRQRFDASRFYAMLDEPSARPIVDDIARQNELFARHLQAVAGDAKRIILCDTGLYGSTQRLLKAGFPDIELETIQFARCNYKGFSEDHFSKVGGLVVEQNFYHPFKPESVILRYWQIIESLFEPHVSSVRFFTEDESGSVTSNAGDMPYGSLANREFNPLLVGAFQYIDAVPSGDQVLRDAEYAWARLKKAIINPTQFDLFALSVEKRSVDFGRADHVHVFNASNPASVGKKIMAVKTNLWREGAIARDFSVLKPALLALLEITHVLRGIRARRF